MGTTLVGSPETIAKGIHKMIAKTGGGCGGFMFRAHEWANRANTMASFELFARWVMPQFQGSLDTVVASQKWASANRGAIFTPSIEAVRRAYTDAGQEPPADFKARLLGQVTNDKT